MIRLPHLLRAARWAASPVLGLAVLACAPAAPAFTPVTRTGSEASPLNLSSPATSSHASGGGPSIVRTIVGLLIVIAVIWGLSWILRQVKSGRETRADGSGLSSLASLPLGSGRSVHIVRAGSEYLILGSAEQGVVPIHRYTEQEARDAGLLELIAAEAHPALPASTTAGTLLDRLREWTVRR